MAKRRRVNATGRNAGDSFIQIPRDMLKSEAWRSLSRGALLVYCEARRRYVGDNNGRVPLSQNEAVALFGMSKTTAVAAFAELEEKGLMRRARIGTFLDRRATEWAFTDKGYAGGLPSNEWRHWRKRKNATTVSTEYHPGTPAIPGVKPGGTTAVPNQG